MNNFLYNSIKNNLKEIEKDNKRFLNYISSNSDNDDNIITVAGKQYVNMSGNDYLGLRFNKDIISKSIEYTKKYGSSSSSSRLITGTIDIYQKLEEDLAKFKGTQKALVFNSGFQANFSILSLLTNKANIGTTPDVFTDKLNHASMHDGLSGIRQKRYKHLDINHFKKLVNESDNESKLAITETVFSMDGDTVDLNAWTNVCKDNDVFSFVDEAHSGGVMGTDGSGIAKGLGIDIVMGTFGKAWAGFGSYVAVDETIYDFLVNKCRGLIYTTALPPSVIGAIQGSLDLMPHLNDARKRLTTISNYVRNQLTDYGYEILGNSHIIPVVIGSDNDTLAISNELKENGFWISAIRHPTVPKGSARLRIAMSASYKDQDIEKMLNILKDFKKKK